MTSRPDDFREFLARAHNRRSRLHVDIVDRFESYLAPEPNTGCLLWTAGVDKDGYGKFTVTLLPDLKQVHLRAHRFAYALANGRWPQLPLLHSCDVAGCCNERHLHEGTQAENIAEKVSRGRQASGDRHGTKTRPDRIARGERHWTALHPELLKRNRRSP